MRVGKLSHALVALGFLMAPLTAWAQFNGNVTTAPLANAPVMGMPTLSLLAILLAGIAVHFLRRGAARGIVVAALVVVLSALSYATSGSIAVTGGQCAMETTHTFDPFSTNVLVNECQNSIQILSVDIGGSCAPACALPCQAGQVLTPGEACTLPMCMV